MAVLAWLAKVARAIIIAIVLRFEISSPEAEEAGHPVTDHVSPAADLVLRIFARETFWVVALVSIKGICVDQGLFEGPPSCFYDLDWPAFPPSDWFLDAMILKRLLDTVGFRTLGDWDTNSGFEIEDFCENLREAVKNYLADFVH